MSKKLNENATALHPWWESVALGIDQTWHCAIGPLSLYLQRQGRQWLVAWEQQSEEEYNTRLIGQETTSIPNELTPTRYIFRHSPAHFYLRPRLLERPVVVKTMQPVNVPPGECVTFYISSPVHVEIQLDDSPAPLIEIPTKILSDTWFGPSTQIGTLCYASKTHTRNSPEDVTPRPHRAVTPVTVRNQSEELLSIDKLSIPVPHLALYGWDDGTLWTSPVSLKQTQGDQLAVLEVGNSPSGANILAEARTPLQKSGLVWAFTSMFSY